MRYLLTILLSLLTYKGDSCTCIGKETIEIALKERDVVFIGKVLSQRSVVVSDPFVIKIAQSESDTVKRKALINGMSIRYDEFNFLITCVYKGKLKHDTVIVTTNDLKSHACGFRFILDSTYIVYADYETKHFNYLPKVNKFLITTTCTRTRSASDKNEIKEIEKYCRAKRRK